MTTKAEQKLNARRRFANEHGVPEVWCVAMRKLANKRADAATHRINGDAHRELQHLQCYSTMKFDQNDNMEWWDAEDDRYIAKLRLLAKAGGFEIDFPGLYPTLNKGGFSYMIPE